uniref:Dehydrogenase/reductase (SDR family) X-linked n=1 Tax=Poecilia mexicana TaxID=48701 RepID=A0A3B3WZ00_9TELE
MQPQVHPSGPSRLTLISSVHKTFENSVFRSVLVQSFLILAITETKTFLLPAEFVFVDLTSLKSVRHFVQKFRDRSLPLHVLINNAGTMLVPERRTEDGFEFHFCLNYLSHFLLTNMLLDLLKTSGREGRCSRIINMASATHYAGEINLEDLNKRVVYSSHGAYSQSKLALVLFTYYLQEQLAAGGFSVTVNAVDPGMVDTALYDNLWTLAQMMKKPVASILFRTPAEGASISVYAAAASEMEGVGGCYLYNGQKTQSSDLSYDSELQTKLWKKSCELVGLQRGGERGGVRFMFSHPPE